MTEFSYRDGETSGGRQRSHAHGGSGIAPKKWGRSALSLRPWVTDSFQVRTESKDNVWPQGAGEPSWLRPQRPRARGAPSTRGASEPAAGPGPGGWSLACLSVSSPSCLLSWADLSQAVPSSWQAGAPSPGSLRPTELQAP